MPSNGLPHYLFINDSNAMVDDTGRVLATLDLSGITTFSVPAASITNAQLAGSITNANLAVPKTVVYQETVTYSQFTDGGGASGTLNLSTSIPAGSVFLRATVHSITGFTGDTSATVIIGDGTDTDRYMTGTPSVFTTAAAGVDLGAPSGTAWHTAAKTPVVTVTSNADFTSVSAGSMVITLFYQRPV